MDRLWNIAQLYSAQCIAGFDKMHRRRKAKLCSRPQQIRHQTAPAWTKFDQVYGLGTSTAQPQVSDPKTDQLAEHLADFGGSNEIAVGPERVAFAVIFGIGFTHIFSNADRAGSFYLLCKPHRKR